MFAVQDADVVLGYIASLAQGAPSKEPDTGAKSSQGSLASRLGQLAVWKGLLSRVGSVTVAWTHGLVEVTADDVCFLFYCGVSQLLQSLWRQKCVSGK